MLKYNHYSIGRPQISFHHHILLLIQIESNYLHKILLHKYWNSHHHSQHYHHHTPHQHPAHCFHKFLFDICLNNHRHSQHYHHHKLLLDPFEVGHLHNTQLYTRMNTHLHLIGFHHHTPRFLPTHLVAGQYHLHSMLRNSYLNIRQFRPDFHRHKALHIQ